MTTLRNKLPPRLRAEVEDWLLWALYNADIEARRGKRRTADEHIVEMNLMPNLFKLRDAILDRTYRPLRGIAFVVHQPVDREVVAGAYRDRIVHHFLFDQVIDWWERRFIAYSFSCRINKGTLYGARSLQRAMRKVSRGGRQVAYIYKFDIQGFFMSLNRLALYERVCWGLDQQFAGKYQQAHKDLLKFLWRMIIFDDPMLGVKIRGSWKEWAKLPWRKSLFFQKALTGICIGNLTSQLLSNIYLDLLDKFITEELGFKFYGRYVDDFYIVVTAEEAVRLEACIPKIEAYLRSLGLVLHPQKREKREVKNGATFLGCKVYLDRMLPGKRLKRNFERACRQVAEGRRNSESVVSYLGRLKHLNARRYEREVLAKYGLSDFLPLRTVSEAWKKRTVTK